MIYLMRRQRGKKLAAFVLLWLALDYLVAPLITVYVTLPLLAEVVHRDPALAGIINQIIGLLR